MGQASMKNFGIVSVSTGYDAAATSVVLSTGDGAKLPSPSATVPSYLVWWNSTDYTDPANDPNVEIVKCTARSTDTLTVVRGQEGSGASTKNTATKTYKMSLAFTAGLYDSIYTDHRFAACGYFQYNSATECLFVPFNGNIIGINGKLETIPDAGVSFPNTSLAVSTLYYAYVYMSSGVMTKEWSTTAHAIESGTGYRIKSGDATRRLVGMARTNASGQFDNNLTVVSWFNLRDRSASGAFSADRSTASTSYVELNTEIRVPFCSWSIESTQIAFSGSVTNSGTTGLTRTSVGIDDATAEEVASSGQPYSGTAVWPFAGSLNVVASEGYHYATLLGLVGAGTGTWSGSGTAGARASLHVKVRG